MYINNLPVVENSPNLVTLSGSQREVYSVTRWANFRLHIRRLILVGSFLKIKEIDKMFWLLLLRKRLSIIFDKKWGWDTFWAIRLETHLVTPETYFVGFDRTNWMRPFADTKK
jgi:hypothetical protein